MALERKDVRSKLDPDWHDVMKRVAARDDLSETEYIEGVLMRELKRRLHEYRLDREAFEGSPIIGISRDDPGNDR